MEQSRGSGGEPPKKLARREGGGGGSGGGAAQPSSGALAATLHANDLQTMQALLLEGVDLEDVKFRPVGGGKNAAYVPAEACVAVANDIFSFDHWACEIKEVKIVHCTKCVCVRVAARSCVLGALFSSFFPHSSPLPRPLCFAEKTTARSGLARTSAPCA